MAITPPNNKVLLREVDEAVRADLLASTWQRFGRWIVLGIVLALALFGGWLWWSSNRTQTAGALSERMARVTEAAENGTPDPKEVEALAKVSEPGYRANALLVKAGLAAKAGKAAEAVALYRQIAADMDFAQSYRELAIVKQTTLEFDRLTPDAVIARLKPLAIRGGPWFGSAGEMTGLAMMKKRDFESAKPIFTALATDANLPESIRSRAVQMAGLLGVDTVSGRARQVQ